MTRLWLFALHIVAASQGMAHAMPGDTHSKLKVTPQIAQPSQTLLGTNSSLATSESASPMLEKSSAQWCGDGLCERDRSTTSTLDTVAIWCKGGVIVSPSALGEWGVVAFGLGRSTADGDRLGVGANFIMKNGNQASHGIGSRRRSVWGAHLNYDALFGGSQGLQFYSHFEFGFLVEVSGSREEQGNEVRPAITTGLGLEYSGEVASKRLRLGPELGCHWAISSPYVIFQFGVDV